MWPVEVHLTQALHTALKGVKGDTGDRGPKGDTGAPGLGGTGSSVWGHLTPLRILSPLDSVQVQPEWFGGDSWKIISGDIERVLVNDDDNGNFITLDNFWSIQNGSGNLDADFATALTFYKIKLQGYQVAIKGGF